MPHRLFGKIMGEPLDIERAAPRIDRARRAALPLQHDLSVAGDACGKIRRQRQRFVERVGMQRLGLALHCRHGFDAGARHVIEDVLRRERPARCLTMGAQRQRTGVLRIELLHQLGPQHARGAELGDLHEVIHANAEEERQPRRKPIDGETKPARTYSTPSASV
jgi:hypothetical protein